MRVVRGSRPAVRHELLDDEDEWPTAPNPPREVPELADDLDPESDGEPEPAYDPVWCPGEPAGGGGAVPPGRWVVEYRGAAYPERYRDPDDP